MAVGDRTDLPGDFREANVFVKSTIYQHSRPAPVDAADLAGANARLAELPLDAVPDPAPLLPGSRMPKSHNPLFFGRLGELGSMDRVGC
ncbi:MAG TPA: hypothetical protein VFG47_04580 [Geminicoccaceae bacterium]|nr:hypothetical protein [Geminicoccaceae bacterium]